MLLKFNTPHINFRVIPRQEGQREPLWCHIPCYTLHLPNRVALTSTRAKTIVTCSFLRNKENHADNVLFWVKMRSKLWSLAVRGKDQPSAVKTPNLFINLIF